MFRGIDPVLFELVNLTISTLCLFVSVILGRYLVIEWKKNKLVLPPFSGMLRHQMAISIVVVMAGEIGMRGWTWFVRISDRMGHDVDYMRFFPYTLAPITFAAIQCLGLLCFIRVFTPDEWGQWTWVVCLIVTALLAISSGVLRF